MMSTGALNELGCCLGGTNEQKRKLKHDFWTWKVFLSAEESFYCFCRYRNGQLLDLSDRDRYEGATLDQPSLVIKSVSRVDNGRYSCVLENQVGASESKNAAALTVYCKYYYVITVVSL